MRTFLIAACAALACTLSAAGFEAPEMIKSGDKPIGGSFGKRDRIYPSPALHDIDGDGLKDLIVGDLFGRLTVAKRTKDGWGTEEKLKDSEGKDLKFKNW